MVLTTTGKKQTRATTITLGTMVKPNQTTRIGATATIGIIWEATSQGYGPLGQPRVGEEHGQPDPGGGPEDEPEQDLWRV